MTTNSSSKPQATNVTRRGALAGGVGLTAMLLPSRSLAASGNEGPGPESTPTTLGTTWVPRSAPLQQWQSVTYGAGRYVAVANSGTGNRVMTSPEGITWTNQSSAADMGWSSIAYGAGVFVAVANSGTGNRVMTSDDGGITWTSQASADNSKQWRSVAFGAGLFVAVHGGLGNQVMTSPDGENWTSQSTGLAQNSWVRMTYGPAGFIAVAQTGDVMRNATGVGNWTLATSTPSPSWTFTGVAGDGTRYVACTSSSFGSNGARVATSTDGDTWTVVTLSSPGVDDWQAVGQGGGVFAVVGGAYSDNTGAQTVLRYANGTWSYVETQDYETSFQWGAVAYGTPGGVGRFVAVRTAGSNRVMTGS